jgi:HEAT repeat protein
VRGNGRDSGTGTGERGRFRRALASLGLACALGLAPLAAAQLQPSPVDRDPLIRRYKSTREGANLDEWARRLEDPRADIRLTAVKSLGESGDPQASRHLVEAALDPDPRVASRAVEYLGRMRAVDATDFLAERLFFAATSDALRRQILNALGRIGDTRASRPILRFIDQTTDPDLRGVAIFALGEIADMTVETDLRHLVSRETDPTLKKIAREALDKTVGRRFEPTPLPPGSTNPLLRPFDP